MKPHRSPSVIPPSTPSHSQLTRRRFLARTSVAVATFSLVPRHVIAGSGKTPPSEKLNLACVGIGGRGGANLSALSQQNIVALCDVDRDRLGAAKEKFPRAKFYQNYRKMLDAVENEIDAVVVSTPDHTHAVAAMEVMERGKHLYCEKPLAHSIHEVRTLMKAAHEHNIITQLGNQGHSFDSIRTFCEWIWDGAIGNVHTVHAYCPSNYSRIPLLPRRAERPPVPDNLDWNIWLGPARYRPYHPMYLPGSWRGWTPFGSGVIGDWVCHVVDPVFWALDLGAPDTVMAQAKDYDRVDHADTFPAGSVVTYAFPAKGNRGPVKLVWYDGVEKPPRPAALEDDDRLPDIGAVVLGDNGTIIYGSHGATRVRIIPQSKMDAYKRPAKTLARSKEHHEDWIEAVRSGGKAGSNFDYGGPLTELALIGIIAIHRLGAKLEWDGGAGRFKNSSEANAYLNPPYREGWRL